MRRDALTNADYAVLSDFRHALRQFLAFSESKVAGLGLTPQQHQALLTIRATESGKATIGYVAERLIIKPHSASSLIARLEALGLLSRSISPGDRRQTQLGLTDKAGILLAELSAAHKEELRRLQPMLMELLARIGD